MMSSDWAMDSVINHYGFPKKKTAVLEFGANIDDDMIVKPAVYQGGKLNLFFSGVDWKRKGGDIAVEAVKRLIDMGVDAHLTIAGIEDLPAGVENLPFVTSVGFLNKNIPQDYKRYVDIWSKTHAFLLPTLAECSAIVYCEAAAYGIPSFTYDTGGTSNYVIDGVNGRSLAEGSTAQDFANVIYDVVKGNSMPIYSENARRLYAEKLSWTAWSRRFKDIMERMF